MLIYFIRHGETNFNKEKRYQGSLDIPLSEEGKKKLCRADFEAEEVYVSTLKRSFETAEILFPGAKKIRVQGLNEMNFGAFEGRTADEMENDPAYRKWVEDYCESRCPGGESREEFNERVQKAVLDIVSRERDKEQIVILAHGGTIMAALERFGNPKRSFYDWLPGNGSGFVFFYDPKEPLETMRLIDEVAYADSFVEMKI